MGVIQVIAGALCGVLALVAVAGLVTGRPFGRAVIVLASAIELVLIVHLVAGVGQLLGTDAVPVVTYLGYLIGVLIVLPAAVMWASVELSRAGPAVILLATLTVGFLLLRTHDIWALAGSGV